MSFVNSWLINVCCWNTKVQETLSSLTTSLDVIFHRRYGSCRFWRKGVNLHQRHYKHYDLLPQRFFHYSFALFSLFREAIALAKVRLSPLDPVLFDLYSTWARKLETDNSFEQAAKWWDCSYDILTKQMMQNVSVLYYFFQLLSSSFISWCSAGPLSSRRSAFAEDRTSGIA